MKKQKKLAIFDIDGTVFRSSLLLRLIDLLVAKSIFPSSAKQKVLQHRSLWFNRKTPYEQYVRGVLKVYSEYISGIPQVAVRNLSEELIQYNKQVYFRFTRQLMEKFKKQGFIRIAISGSVQEVVEEFNKYIKFDHVFGMRFEVIGGMYTGKILYDPVKDKKQFLLDFVKKHNYSLRCSWGIGDTDADIGMLEAVEHPIAFNPNKKLYDMAKKNDWQIVVERKDVVYQINNKPHPI